MYDRDDRDSKPVYSNLRDRPAKEKPLISEGLMRRMNMYQDYEDPEELMKKTIYFVFDFLDDRNQRGIVRSKKGTYYFERSDVPPGLDVVMARFSYQYMGETTGSYKGLYLIVDDGSAGTMREGVNDIGDPELAFKVYRYLSQLGKNVELNYDKIIIYEDRALVDIEIDRFLSKLDMEVGKIKKQDYMRRKKEALDVVDDDTIID